jgi:DNA-binding beta-propeller fold protein YncE
MTRSKLMHRDFHIASRVMTLIALTAMLTMLSTRLHADSSGSCGGATTTIPFNDVQGNNIFFCAIAEAYFSGLTNGITATVYGPAQNVPREQMAAFITRTQDSGLRRGNRRAALNQWATPKSIASTARTLVDDGPLYVQSDGKDLWVSNSLGGTVSRVRASDGRLLGTWTGANDAAGVLVARGRVYVTGSSDPGRLYAIDPDQPAGQVLTVTSGLGAFPYGITTDGIFIWTANAGGSVSKFLPDNVSVETFTAGFNSPTGILYDGANVWITEQFENTLKKLNSDDGTIAQTVNVGTAPRIPIFDGTNIWVPNLGSNSVTVVRTTGALAGTVLATLTGNGLNSPYGTAFDGQRILVTNFNQSSLSMWKAADLTPLGVVSTGGVDGPAGACSDGINFWIAFTSVDRLGRF